MAGLTAQLQALTVPYGTEFPGAVQGLLVLIAQYMQITGLSDFNGINFGSSEPAAENRDKPWFKTDDAGNPLGWFTWNGTSWSAMPNVIPSGDTSARPAAPQEGQEFFDTDIDALLIYRGAAWITASGSPGDIKFVEAATLDAALTKNPGWSNYTNGVGYVLAGADEDTYNATVGSGSYTLTIADLPNDTINFQSGVGVFPGQFQNGSQSPGVNPITTGLGSGSTSHTAPINPGTQSAISLYQPTRFVWCLKKD